MTRTIFATHFKGKSFASIDQVIDYVEKNEIEGKLEKFHGNVNEIYPGDIYEIIEIEQEEMMPGMFSSSANGKLVKKHHFEIKK